MLSKGIYLKIPIEKQNQFPERAKPESKGSVGPGLGKIPFTPVTKSLANKKFGHFLDQILEWGLKGILRIWNLI